MESATDFRETKRRKLSPPISVDPSVSDAKQLEQIKSGDLGIQNPVPSTESNVTPFTAQRNSFADIGVRPWIVASLANLAIRKPTSIQEGCIPEILKGRDCIGGSKTGSGKTVAFVSLFCLFRKYIW